MSTLRSRHYRQVALSTTDFTPETERQRIQELASSHPALLGDEFSPLQYLKRTTSKDLGEPIYYRDHNMQGWSIKTAEESDLKPSVIAGVGKRQRVMQTIGVTRGFGDFDLKINVSPSGLVTKYDDAVRRHAPYYRDHPPAPFRRPLPSALPTPSPRPAPPSSRPPSSGQVFDTEIRLKPFLLPTPEILVHDLVDLVTGAPSIDDVVVMATDGLWDVMSNDAVAASVSASFLSGANAAPARQRYTLAAQDLVMQVRGLASPTGNRSWRLPDGRHASEDDVTCLVIPLRGAAISSVEGRRLASESGFGRSGSDVGRGGSGWSRGGGSGSGSGEGTSKSEAPSSDRNNNRSGRGDNAGEREDGKQTRSSNDAGDDDEDDDDDDEPVTSITLPVINVFRNENPSSSTDVNKQKMAGESSSTPSELEKIVENDDDDDDDDREAKSSPEEFAPALDGLVLSTDLGIRRDDDDDDDQGDDSDDFLRRSPIDFDDDDDNFDDRQINVVDDDDDASADDPLQTRLQLPSEASPSSSASEPNPSVSSSSSSSSSRSQRPASTSPQVPSSSAETQMAATLVDEEVDDDDGDDDDERLVLDYEPLKEIEEIWLEESKEFVES